jgi:predicted GNAT family N-acyltransferase
MRIEQIGALGHERWEALVDGEEDPFGAADDPTEWCGKDFHTVLFDGDRPVASVGLVVAQTDAFDVVGVGGVIVTRSRRGEGLLRRTLEAALERAATLGPDVAMLFCLDHVVGLYERMGFVDFPGPVTVDQPDGPTQIAYHTMLRGAAPAPASLRLRGLPF